MKFEELGKSSRLLMHAALRPLQGDRFQPTGFADLGAAVYTLPDQDGKKGSRMLLLESAQSVANRLEKACLEGDGPHIDQALQGLPYVVCKLTGLGEELETSSLIEAHRIASPFFLGNKEFAAKLTLEMAYDKRRLLDWRKIYATLFKYDPNCLLHGVFLSLLDGGRVRTPRAITGFIEAGEVEPVITGGVKNSSVDPKGNLQATEADFDKGVYSNVPYSRIEYTAARITAYFNLDLALIRGYGLSKAAQDLLIGLALFKVRRFLNRDLRLRTACDLTPIDGLHADAPPAFVIPGEEELLAAVHSGILACTKEGLFSDPPVTVITTPVTLKEKVKRD